MNASTIALIAGLGAIAAGTVAARTVIGVLGGWLPTMMISGDTGA